MVFLSRLINSTRTYDGFSFPQPEGCGQPNHEAVVSPRGNILHFLFLSYSSGALTSKVKWRLCLGLINYVPCHEDVWGRWTIVPPLSALDGGEWSASRPCHCTPGKEPPVPHCIGGWAGLRDGLDVMEITSCPSWELMPDSSVIQPVA
jgi:hypothetical protein